VMSFSWGVVASDSTGAIISHCTFLSNSPELYLHSLAPSAKYQVKDCVFSSSGPNPKFCDIMSNVTANSKYHPSVSPKLSPGPSLSHECVKY
jgi:hypothetical protein